MISGFRCVKRVYNFKNRVIEYKTAYFDTKTPILLSLKDFMTKKAKSSLLFLGNCVLTKVTEDNMLNPTVEFTITGVD